MARIPLVYNLRNLAARRVSTALTALGIALVAWVFIFTLALAGGFQAALTVRNRLVAAYTDIMNMQV